MEKIALIADSTCDLEKAQIEQYDIKVLPLKIIYKNKEYLDRIEISPQEVYDNIETEIPTTSLPSLQEIDTLFNKLEDEGYTHTICIHLSSNISGTYNSVKLIADEHPKLTSTVFDSKSLTLGTGAIVLACSELIEQNKSYEEIVNKLPSIKEKISVFYVVDTLKYLIKGGRIGKVSGTLGSVLNIKPIISINDDGVYYTYDKIRGKKHATKKLFEIAEERLKNSKSKIWIMHGGAEAEGKLLFEKMKTLQNITSLNFGQISPVLGVHTGPGLIGFIIAEEPLF
ncbi:DegV family protein [Clostridium sp. DL1XJH146]